MERTKIVCTIGPSSKSKNKLKQMIKAGMDCARLNFSHGTHSDHRQMILHIREAVKELNKPVPIIQDLQGPKIRVGMLPEAGVELKRNKDVVLRSGKVMRGEIIPINYYSFDKIIQRGDYILLDDGLMKLKVLRVSRRKVFCRVVFGGRLLSNKGVNLPTIKVKVPSITPKDKKDIEFGIRNNVDFIALSFVQDAEDILELRKIIGRLEKQYGFRRKNIPSTKIISKIEKRLAVENIDDIIRISDGVMIARGDLGVEMSLREIPLLQKNIIIKCLNHAKPVITATHMLESMIERPAPTRAEVTDVANSVIDHTDAVMLSAESATGRYPIRAVKIMNEIIADTEESSYDDLTPLEKEPVPYNLAVSYAAADLAKKIRAKGIIVTTLSGLTAQTVSRYRPELPIIALVSHKKICRQLNLDWGISSLVIRRYKNIELLLKRSVSYVKSKRIFKKGDRVILVSGHPTGKSGVTNLIKVLDIP